MTAISWIPSIRNLSINYTAAQITEMLDTFFGNLNSLDLLQTTDTGQYITGDQSFYENLPAAGGTLAYRVYRLEDALVNELPLYIKVEMLAGFGSGKTTTGYALGSKITVGTATNGAGGITDNALTTQTLIGYAHRDTYPTTVTPKQSFASTNPNKGFFGVIYNPGVNSGNTYGSFSNYAQFAFFIERIPNADGTPSIKGFTLWGQNINHDHNQDYFNPNGNLQNVATLISKTRLVDSNTTLENTQGGPYFPQTSFIGSDLLVNHLYHSTPLPVRATCMGAIRRGVIASGAQLEVNTYGEELINFVSVDAGETALRPTHYVDTNLIFSFQ